MPSLLRNFSAPVKLDYPYSDDDLALLMTHDSDPFVRWEAGQIQALQLIMGLVADYQEGRELKLDEKLVSRFRSPLLPMTSRTAPFWPRR